MLKKAESVLQKYAELSDKLADAGVLADMEQWKKISKEHADLSELAAAAEEYKRVSNEMSDAFEMAEAEEDREMKEMLLEEGYACKERLVPLADNLKILLLPKDKNDERDCILEIRAGVGGEEAALFAGQLLRMYQGFCSKNRLKLEIEDENATELGGIKEVSAHVSGNGAYKLLKHESGVHRVQRVPETETQGRIHTSTATVAVMPEAEEVDVEIRPEDLRIETCRAGGAGGQHVNRTESAVQIFHLPTGIMVRCENERSQLKNKETGMRILRARLFEMKQREAQESYSAQRRALIGSGGREEKIRTYNFPQNRFTDHRIGYTAYNLDIVVTTGALDEVIARMQHVEMEERMDELK